MTDHSHDNWKPASNPWAVAIVVTPAVFMEILDTTIVNVALPHVAGSLSASYDESTGCSPATSVANGIVLPISAFLSRLFGRKQFFLICIVMFTICSFLCGIATELWQIILFRVMQGFFGGGLQPTQQSVLLDYFKPEDRGKAFGLSSIAIIVAPVLGPTLGGWITDNYSPALGVLYQYPGRDCDGAGHLSAAGRSAVGEKVGREAHRRLDGDRPDRPRSWLFAGDARPGRR